MSDDSDNDQNDQELRQIWQLSDVTKDGCLSLEEFLTAMHLVVLRRSVIREDSDRNTITNFHFPGTRFLSPRSFPCASDQATSDTA